MAAYTAEQIRVLAALDGNTGSTGEEMDKVIDDIEKRNAGFARAAGAGVTVGVVAAWAIVIALLTAVVIIFLTLGDRVLEVINEIG
jgi:hypothetical protein